MTDRVVFTKSSGDRIAKAVRAVEAGNRDEEPFITAPRFSPGVSGNPIRFCSWTATWSHGTTATITFDPATNLTATATNVYLGMGPGSGWAARHGTAGWRLIGADLSLQPSYSSTEIQLLGHDDSGIANWYSITTCATATA